MANIKKKINLKLITILLAASMSFVGLSSSKVAKAAETPAPDEVTVPALSTTVSTNMLNVDGAIITEVMLENLVGKNQDIKATFSHLPNVSEKIFAVLVDEIAGGVISAQYVENKKVEFKNIPEYIKIPGIHLYKQSPTDPEFLLRKENFIASTSYLMPYGRKIVNNGGLSGFDLTGCRGNGTQYGEDVPKATLYTTTVPDVYSFAIPANFFTKIGAENITAKDIFAIIIADDANGKPVSLHPVVSTDYNETELDKPFICRFEFLLPAGIENFQVHIYKKGLYEENFVCKFLGKITKQPASVYDLP